MLPPAGKDHPRLAVSAFGLNFPNPVGMAAGFDKHAEVPDVVLRFGFGFVEVGTVTPQPQMGNPLPRVFRLDADEAVINRLGFNNDGAAAIRKCPVAFVGDDIAARRITARCLTEIPEQPRGRDLVGLQTPHPATGVNVECARILAIGGCGS